MPITAEASLASSPSRRQIVLMYLGIWFLALAVRAVYLWQIKDAPAFSLLMGDALSYDQWAQEIAKGNWLGGQIFYQAPLYPYFLGTLYAIVGHDLLWVRVVQIVLGATSCVFLASAGRSFFGVRTGVIAGILLALYAPAIFFDGLIQKSVLDLFFMCLLLHGLGKISEGPKAPRWVFAGVVLGCLILVRENALVLVLAVVLWIPVQFRGEPWPKRLGWIGWFVLGLAVMLLPVAARNKIVGGEFHLTTAQFGPNFYIGNNEHARGTYQPLHFGHGTAEHERRDATELAEQELGRRLSPAEVSRFWTRKAMAYIDSNPGSWLRLMAKKWLLVWNATESIDTEDPYTYGDWSALLRGLLRLFHFGILCPLAVFGIGVTWRDWPRIWLLHLMLFSYAASVALFYVFARYRFPMTPLLVLFSSAGLTSGIVLVRQKRYAMILCCGVLAVALGIVANWRLIPEAAIRARTQYNLGVYLASQQGKRQEAATYYLRALELSPEFPEAHNNLGVALTDQGRLEEATAHYSEAVRLRPDYDDAHFNLGVVLARQGKLTEAVVHFSEAIKLNPSDAEAHCRLGAVLVRQGDFQAAAEHFREALRIDPNRIDARQSLDRILTGQQKTQ